MRAAKITFIGGPECGNVGSDTWGNDATGSIVFPINQAVLVDPAAAASRTEGEFLEHVIAKAANNRFYKVEPVEDGDRAKPAAVKQPEPKPRTVSNPKRKKAAEAEAA